MVMEKFDRAVKEYQKGMEIGVNIDNFADLED